MPESTDLPENATVAEAVALMDNLEADDTNAAAPAAGDAEPEQDAFGESEGAEPARDGAEDAGEGGGEGEGEAEAAASEEAPVAAPEFWAAEDKAAWETIPVALRPTILKYEQMRKEFAETKAQEAAKIRQEAIDQAKQATSVVEEGAKWWQQHGPQFFKAFGDKWAQVDWNKLAEENPAEWARLKQTRDNEAQMLQQANQRGMADIETANRRAEEQKQESRRISHEKLAREMPEHFGTTERSTKTYDELGKYLLEQEIPVERINAIHEAPIIKLALKAKLYDAAKKQASTVAKPGAANNTAKQTPTRVQPGPATRTGSQGGERARQASERINSGRSLTAREAAALANSLGL